LDSTPVDNGPACPVCASPVLPALQDRPDREYGVATRLRYWRCRGCGHVFAAPVPSELLPSFYASYSTHRVEGIAYPGFWRVMRWLTPNRRPTAAIRGLPHLRRDAAILDYGCGGGALLNALQAQGFVSLAGYDFDPKAAARHLQGVTFFESESSLRRARFDIIILNHVIEHLEDPRAALQMLLSVLRPAGRIVLRTPNSESFLARLFGTYWRGWETPRHLNVFNRESLARLAASAGCGVVLLETSNDMLTGMFIGTMNALLRGVPKKLAIALGYAPACWASWIAEKLQRDSGEELVAVLQAGTP